MAAMKSTTAFAAALSAAIVTACGTPMPQYDPVANLRGVSYSDARINAEATKFWINEHSEAAVIEVAKETIRSKMKDPESTQFRNVRVVKYGTGALVCGEVNSKNSYGGYVGFKRFYAGPDNRSVIEHSGGRYADIDAAANAGLYAACVYGDETQAAK